VAFPGDSVVDIQAALSIQADMLDWVGNARCSQMGDAELQQTWQAWAGHFLDGAGALR
jgi:hypothetical protein